MSIYFILCESLPDPIVKIGKTNNIKQRIQSISTSTPFPIKLIATCEGIEEKDLHAKFSHLRVKNEWFRFENEIKEFIEVNGMEIMENSHSDIVDIDKFISVFLDKYQNIPDEDLDIFIVDELFIFANKPLDYEWEPSESRQIYKLAKSALKIIKKTSRKKYHNKPYINPWHFTITFIDLYLLKRYKEFGGIGTENIWLKDDNRLIMLSSLRNVISDVASKLLWDSETNKRVDFLTEFALVRIPIELYSMVNNTYRQNPKVEYHIPEMEKILAEWVGV